jgi:hypothetical protein
MIHPNILHKLYWQVFFTIKRPKSCKIVFCCTSSFLKGFFAKQKSEIFLPNLLGLFFRLPLNNFFRLLTSSSKTFTIMAWFVFTCLLKIVIPFFCNMKLIFFYLSYGIRCIDRIVVRNNTTHFLNIIMINLFIIINIFFLNRSKCIYAMNFPFNFLSMQFMKVHFHFYFIFK